MNWKRALVGVVLSLPVLGLLAWGMGQDPTGVRYSPLVGNEAPAFTLGVLDGTPTRGAVVAADPATGEPAVPDTIRLDAHRGEIVIVNFFASWCLECRREHGVLDRAARRLAGEGVRVYGVVYDDSPENALRWIQQMGGQVYPAVVDPGSRTAIDYGLRGVPETFFIAPDGTVARKHIGAVTDALIDEVIAEIRATQTAAAS